MTQKVATPNVRTATVYLVATSRYSQNGVVMSKKMPREGNEEFELRTWKERAHIRDRTMYIPGMQVRQAIIGAAALNPMKKQGKQQWKNTLLSGILPIKDIQLDLSYDDIPGEWVYVPSNGKPGGGSRVWKCFPYVDNWEGEVTFGITNRSITSDIFQQYLGEAGLFVGLGRWRPQKGGMYGKFKVKDIKIEGE